VENTCSRFIQYLAVEKASSPNTINAYRTDLEQFRRVLQTVGAPGPGELTKLAMQHYVDWLHTQGYRAATIARKMAAVRSLLAYLSTQEGWDLLALAKVLDSPPAPPRAPFVLSVDELDRLLAAPRGVGNPRARRDAAILSTLYAAGLRVADAVNLDVRHVDLEQRVLHTADEPPRRIPLGRAFEPLQDYLRAGRPHLNRQPREAALFLNQSGQRLTRQGIWLAVKRWAGPLGLEAEISPQTLRHTLARDLLRRGKSRKEVQKALGLVTAHALPPGYTNSTDTTTR
jgi:integrase/recombinase XerD